MRKFKYITKDSQKTIEQISQEYYNIVQSNLSIRIKNHEKVLKSILLCPVNEMNDNTHKEFMSQLKPNISVLFYRIDMFFNYFFGKEYFQLQPLIADFVCRNFNFKICPYCGIDYVNSFKECLTYYSDFEDFIFNATFNELSRLDGIGDIKAEKILVDRCCIEKSKFEKKYKSLEVKFNKLKIKPKYYNHFTLDHIYPKSKYPLFQILLYNLIPVCYSCNSKFKGVFELAPNLIPNSENYLLDKNVKFCLIEEDETLKIDYQLFDDQNKNNIIDYIKEFKIVGRYNEHLNTIIYLKSRSENYNRQKIDEISRQTGISVDELRRLIFGDDIFNKDSDIQLYKLRTDISKDLGIL